MKLNILFQIINKYQFYYFYYFVSFTLLLGCWPYCIVYFTAIASI